MGSTISDDRKVFVKMLLKPATPCFWTLLSGVALKLGDVLCVVEDAAAAAASLA
jgi:hypothetical protein